MLRGDGAQRLDARFVDFARRLRATAAGARPRRPVRPDLQLGAQGQPRARVARRRGRAVPHRRRRPDPGPLLQRPPPTESAPLRRRPPLTVRDRTPSPRRWNLCATIYRALVVAQTLAWAVETLVRITTRAASAAPTRATLAIASIIALGAGLLTYYACRSRWPARAAVLLAWPSFQAAGILALLAYALTP